ncbi:HAD-IA family hydrolase [Spiribacter sp. 1M153]|uniref:HAD-IA family hydrolase n=1 Tax=Spiribacter roseus TaxID=1855875 RepID=UPI00349F9CF9
MTAATGERAHGVLLDLDGTLLDTAPDLIDSLNRLRAEQGLAPMADAEFLHAVGHGSIPMIARGFNRHPGDAGFDALRERFLAIYAESVSRRTRPYAGMEATLQALEAAAIPWGIVTNKPGWLTTPLLADLGYAGRPACVVTGDDLARRKPHPYQITEAARQLDLPASACLVVGDTERDIRAGHQAGALTVVALYGYLSGDDHVEHWGADGLIGQPAELLRWVADPAAPHRQAIAV